MLIPVILIFGLEKILEPATLGTLIGGLIGYTLGSVGDSAQKARSKSGNQLVERSPSR
jgi:membrane protein YqaA with SNARE-associated domain